MATIQTAVTLRTQPGKLWKGITRHEDLPLHSSILREVKVVQPTEKGVGTIRQCTLKSGKSFTEQITRWEEGKVYCYRPDMSGGVFPLKEAEACWSIEPHGSGSRLAYRLNYQPSSRLRGILLYPVLRTYGIYQIKKMLKSYDT